MMRSLFRHVCQTINWFSSETQEIYGPLSIMHFMGLFFPSMWQCACVSVLFCVNPGSVLRWIYVVPLLSFSKLLFWTGMEAAVFTTQVLAYIYQNLLFISFSIRERSQATCLSNKFTLLWAFRSEQIMLTLMNWVFMSDANEHFHRDTRQWTILVRTENHTKARKYWGFKNSGAVER